VSVGPRRSDDDEFGRRVRFGEVDRECADARDLSSWERFRAAGFAVMACARTSPGVTALSGRRRRAVSEANTPVSSVRFGGGVGPVRRGPPRRGAALDFVAAVRLRGDRTAAASEECAVDLVAVGPGLAVAVRLSLSVVLPPAAPPRRDLARAVRPVALSRALIHSNYPPCNPRNPSGFSGGALHTRATPDATLEKVTSAFAKHMARHRTWRVTAWYGG
jgi:hypothetical protein